MTKNVINNKMILIVDDHKPIHDDFAEILSRQRHSSEKLNKLAEEFFGDSDEKIPKIPKYKLDSAFQGQDSLQMVEEAIKRNEPYALVFMDVRMPPGWDGIETIKRIWEVDPDLQVVICTAYADYSWEEIYSKFGDTDSLVFLRKPFDNTEVRQLASSLTQKWNYARQSKIKMEELEELVQDRTIELRATVSELEDAITKIKTLKGLVPICASCKKIRDDQGFWNQVEVYVSKHSEAEFSHSICPPCAEKLYPELYKKIIEEDDNG